MASKKKVAKVNIIHL